MVFFRNKLKANSILNFSKTCPVKRAHHKYYFTYIEFDYSIRRYIYTTNGIENLNCQIRKATKHKISFENEDRLLDYVFVVIKDFERNNWLKYQVKSFKVWKEYEN